MILQFLWNFIQHSFIASFSYVPYAFTIYSYETFKALVDSMEIQHIIRWLDFISNLSHCKNIFLYSVVSRKLDEIFEISKINFKCGWIRFLISENISIYGSMNDEKFIIIESTVEYNFLGTWKLCHDTFG